jgi:hypothetical protein
LYRHNEGAMLSTENSPLVEERPDQTAERAAVKRARARNKFQQQTLFNSRWGSAG